MDIVLLLICMISFLAAYSVVVVDSMHFFQLNSYDSPTHLKWIKKNARKYTPVLVTFAAGLGLFCLSVNIFFIGISLLFILNILLLRPKKAKKPLVYTNRVKRMLIGIGFLILILFIFLYHFQSIKASALIVLVLYLFSPFIVLLINLINMPIEKSINQHYINEARKILNSAKGLTIIGITGSYGKTSMKYFLTTLLKAKYNVLMTPESYNTPMGIVKTIRGSLNAMHEIFVCEMGAKKVGEIKEICDIVHPDHGIITSIGPQHLETFKSLENVKKTKFELADSLPENGMMFINGDDGNIADYPINRPFIRYSINGKGDYHAYDIKLSDRGTTFRVQAPGGDICDFRTKLIGAHNVLNITGAIAAANSMGIPLHDLKAQVKKIEGVPHRLQLMNKGGHLIIDDSYNSNPVGVMAALETLSLFDGFKIIVTPGMVELGDKQDEYNFEFAGKAASVCDYVIILGQTNNKSLSAGLAAAGYPDSKIYPAGTIQDAFHHINIINSEGRKKIILIENDLPDNF